MSRFAVLVVLSSAAAFAAPSVFKAAQPRIAPLFSASNCVIKGNISIDTGERIYHVPGQKFYQSTRISRLFGERWFCSEAEARAAGWRRSRR